MPRCTGTFDFHVRGDRSLYAVTVTGNVSNIPTFKSILVQTESLKEAVDFVNGFYPNMRLCSVIKVDELYNV